MLTVILSASQGLGISRISIPYLLGSAISGRRQRAMIYGLVVHSLVGLGAAMFYALVFEQLGSARWWSGLILGAIHGLAILTVFLQVLPYVHPRMASRHQGPTPTRQLEPPGFLGLNYGRGTPIVTWFAHLVYGLILGAFY